MPLRILHIVTYMGRGGLETMLMNYYRHIDREKLQFDFLVHRSFEADYDAEIRSLGGRIYHLPQLNPFSKDYLNRLDRFFRDHREYKIVHCHLDCMAGIPLRAAMKNGVPVRIAHSHNSNQTKDVKFPLKLYYKRIIPEVSTERFACGEQAGKWMFGNAKFSVLNNAIDAELYSYNAGLQHDVRKELNIPDEAFVVGHVGRFDPQKNHSFIIECFAELKMQRENAVLLLVGDGVLREQIEQKARQMSLENNIIFAGQRSDVNRMLQAMDVFLFPSLYEGLPLSIIEAQAAGLPCLISERVPEECRKTENVFQYSLEDGAEKWAEYILLAGKVKKSRTFDEICAKGFDVRANAVRLQEYYLSKYPEAEQQQEAGARSDVRLTVFTPAYNRAHTLPRTYESLKKQDCRDFEWLIVDDGSEDETESLVRGWQKAENDFRINYIRKPNGGMHTAHNTAYDNIKTELNVCIDSDDCLAEGAVSAILRKWDEVSGLGYAGIIALNSDMKGNIIGKGFSQDLRETTLSGYYASGGSGDKKLVYRTDVIKAYPPYPVFEGERYVALAYKYRLIDQDYKLAVLDKVLCNVDYQADGSSGTMWKQYLKYPKGFAFWRKVCMTYPESRKRMVVDCIHYVSSSIIAHNRKYIAESPRPLLTGLCTPAGGILVLLIKYKAGRN